MTKTVRRSFVESNAAALLLAVACSVLTLIPPTIIGSGDSARTLQALEHWIAGAPDSFAFEHAHWMWLPWVIARLCGSCFTALLVFKALLAFGSVMLTYRALLTIVDSKRAFLALLLVVANVGFLYTSHTFDPALSGLFVSSLILFLTTRESQHHHRLAYLFIGLSVAISLYAFLFILGAFVMVRSMIERSSKLRSRETLICAALFLAGLLSWCVTQVFLFGYPGRIESLRMTTYDAQGISNLVLGLLVVLFSLNLFLVPLLKSGLSRKIDRARYLPFFLALATLRSPQIQPYFIVLLPALAFLTASIVGKLEEYVMAYAVINITLFLFLPAWQNQSQAFMPVERRAATGDAVTWGHYASTVFQGRSQLLAQKQVQDEASSLLQAFPSDSSIVITDGSTHTWFDGATLGAMYPDRKIGWYYGRPLNVMQLNGLSDTEYTKPCLAIPRLIAIFDKAYAHEFIDRVLPPGFQMRESEHLQAFALTTEESRRALVDRLIYLHYHSFH